MKLSIFDISDGWNVEKWQWGWQWVWIPEVVEDSGNGGKNNQQVT